jgi:hypothetical protein
MPPDVELRTLALPGGGSRTAFRARVKLGVRRALRTSAVR